MLKQKYSTKYTEHYKVDIFVLVNYTAKKGKEKNISSSEIISFKIKRNAVYGQDKILHGYLTTAGQMLANVQPTNKAVFYEIFVLHFCHSF